VRNRRETSVKNMESLATKEKINCKVKTVSDRQWGGDGGVGMRGTKGGESRNMRNRDVLYRKSRGGRTRKEWMRVMKCHIPRNAHPMTNRIQTMIALMLITISKKHTLNRLSS
jgi:hypothetical protein